MAEAREFILREFVNLFFDLTQEQTLYHHWTRATGLNLADF